MIIIMAHGGFLGCGQNKRFFKMTHDLNLNIVYRAAAFSYDGRCSG